jgi:hypothetical protein
VNECNGWIRIKPPQACPLHAMISASIVNGTLYLIGRSAPLSADQKGALLMTSFPLSRFLNHVEGTYHRSTNYMASAFVSTTTTTIKEKPKEIEWKWCVDHPVVPFIDPGVWLASIVHNHRIWYIGRDLQRIHVYDSMTNEWRDLSPTISLGLPHTLDDAYFAMTIWYNKIACVASSYNIMYDINTNRWYQLPRLTQAGRISPYLSLLSTRGGLIATGKL